MIVDDFSWKIAGEAGDGILSAGLMFAKSCLIGGLYVHATAEYPSLIRGGHNHLDVRVSARPLYSHTKRLSLLVALNSESIKKHTRKLLPGGGIIYDSEETKINPEEVGRSDISLFPMPLLKMANACGGKIMRNVIAMGATLALVDYDCQLFNHILSKNFAKKGQPVIDNNIKAAKAGYDYIRQNFAHVKFPFRVQRQGDKNNIFLSGNEAICVGAVKAGCKFFSGYPMTPASSVMHTMASFEKTHGVVVKHTEDEIAGINMAIGAGFAGVRAMTATSGGGFALMTEGFGLAAQTETPLVVVEAQRPGPATGMATHSGQGDLRFMLHASTDEFPRIIIAPGDVQECYYLTIQAFNLAEKYQMPVIVLTDKFLGESFATAPAFSGNEIKVERGEMLKEVNEEDYRRYRVTKSGVSPRSIPGVKGGEHVASSYEHDEFGFEREEEHVRMAMHEKRFRKFANAAKEIAEPQLIGPENAEITIFCWGSTKGPALEAMRLLMQKGISANMLHVTFLSPLPAKKIAEVMRKAKLTIDIEGNKTAQFAGIVKQETGLEFNCKILKYDGRPFNPEDLATAIKDLATSDAHRIIILNGWQEAVKLKSEGELLLKAPELFSAVVEGD
ncbi:MAG: 2-oxoacid:acceptor oxidoreductase subunit alpha [Candidatus Aenigmarchaeota archaeon]|nr:2-oxoacid:acceptor oxidoreductase subunit alpha [Candidatus Aenigmarchaeota archaeon]